MVKTLLIGLLLLGIGLWVVGRKKNSRLTVFIGGIGTITPLLYFAGAGLWLPFAPLLSLGAAYWTVNTPHSDS